MDYKPVIDDIVKDSVLLYAHTMLRVGIEQGDWYKVGTSKYIGEKKDIDSVIFANTREFEYINWEIIDVDPLKNWSVWNLAGEGGMVSYIPEGSRSRTYPGSVYPPYYVLDWMKYGYTRTTEIIFTVLKRQPLPGIHSYICAYNSEDTTYYHFIGDEAVAQLVIKDGHRIKLTVDQPNSACFNLRKAKFGDTNWKQRNFISKEEFDKAWDFKAGSLKEVFCQHLNGLDMLRSKYKFRKLWKK